MLDLSSSDPDISSSVRMDVLVAGSPCQGFSTMGQRRVDDPRNTLLLVAARVAAKHRPKVVVAENVMGALAGEHRLYWDALRTALRSQGYKTKEFEVNSADFGVAQHRRRAVMVAWRTPAHDVPDFETSPRTTLAVALAGLRGLANHDPIELPADSRHRKIAERIGPGQKLTNARTGQNVVHTWDIPEVFGRTNKHEREVLATILRMRRQNRRRDFGDADPLTTQQLRRAFGKELLEKLVQKGFMRKLPGGFHDLTSTFNGKYRRPELQGLSRTVDTRFGDYTSVLHPTEHRGYTIREAARIQGFPDAFEFFGPMKEQFRMIGNAVPPPVGLAIARSVRQLL